MTVRIYTDSLPRTFVIQYLVLVYFDFFIMSRRDDSYDIYR